MGDGGGGRMNRMNNGEVRREAKDCDEMKVRSDAKVFVFGVNHVPSLSVLVKSRFLWPKDVDGWQSRVHTCSPRAVASWWQERG